MWIIFGARICLERNVLGYICREWFIGLRVFYTLGDVFSPSSESLRVCCLVEKGDLVPTISLLYNKPLFINGLVGFLFWQYGTWVPFFWMCFLNDSLKAWFCKASGDFVNYWGLAICPSTYRLKVLNTTVSTLGDFKKDHRDLC